MTPRPGFLDVIRRERGDGSSSGDQHGGGAGDTGGGLPTGLPGNFLFATGIECSYPTIANGSIRRDLLAETGHDDRWEEDLQLVHDLGIRVLRYGLPYHRVHLGKDRYDWAFADRVLARMRELEITPILDLLHFGLPDWLGDFQNPEVPVRFAEYAGAVARRYPWVRHYTPVNEIFVTAKNSGKTGAWNEQLKTDAGFVTALKHLVAAAILATHEIADATPNAIMFQSESAEYTHEMLAVTSDETRLWNKLRFLALDLLYAHPPDADVCMFALDNGLTRAEYDWFMVGEPPGYQVVGIDYYGRNERLIMPDGSMCTAEDVLGWYQIANEYHDRYRKPLMHTETNVFDAETAPTWLWKQWANVLRLRADGVPVFGFTWYSLIDQVDWDIELREKKGAVNACGLFDLDRKRRPVADAYESLLKEFGRIPVMPHAELLEVTAQPARLRSEN